MGGGEYLTDIKNRIKYTLAGTAITSRNAGEVSSARIRSITGKGHSCQTYILINIMAAIAGMLADIL